MTLPMIAPPRADETWTLTDLTDDTDWVASRRGVTDDAGVTWIVTDDTGWLDAPDVRLTATAQPRGDGATLSQLWRGPRVITLKGSAHLPCTIPEATIDVARRRWLGMCAEGPRAGSLSAVAPDGVGVHAPVVVVSDQPKASVIRSSGWERRFAWQLTVTAADPRLYAVGADPVSCGLPQPGGGLIYPLTYPLDYHTPTDTGQVLITNDGTATTWPRLLITAPFDNPTVSNPDTGDSLTIALTDPNAGDYLLIDTNPLTRRVLLNGAATRRGFARSSGEWLPCRPHTTTRLRYRASTFSTSRLAVTAPPAFW